MKTLKLAGAIPALALVASFGIGSDAQASTVTGFVGFEASGTYTSGGFDADTGGAATQASTNVGYEINVIGTGTLTNTLSSQTDLAPGWIVTSEGTVTGAWSNPPIQELEDGVSVTRSLSETIPGPLSFEGLGNLPVAPGGTVTYLTALALLQDPALFGPGGTGFTFGGGQNILPAGDTITGTIDFTTGAFDLLFRGNDAVASLVMFTDFQESLGIAPSSTLTSIFGTTDNWDRSVLAFLPDSGTFSTSATIAPVPLPAAGWLLLTAFGGLGLAARRRRKAA